MTNMSEYQSIPILKEETNLTKEYFSKLLKYDFLRHSMWKLYHSYGKIDLETKFLKSTELGHKIHENFSVRRYTHLTYLQ